MIDLIEKFVLILEKSDYNRAEVAEATYRLYTKLLEEITIKPEDRFKLKDLVKRIRNIRASFKHELLEYVMLEVGVSVEFANLATIVFVIETQITLLLYLDKWKKELESKTTTEVSDYSFGEELSASPERQFLRFPLSQLYSILELYLPFHKFKEEEDIEELEDYVDELFGRISLLLNLKFSEDDLNMSEYRIEIEDSMFISNFNVAADLRILFDSIIMKINTFNEISKKTLEVVKVEESSLEDLKKTVHILSSNFERDNFLDSYTEFVLSNKICTSTFRKLYYRKFPEVNNPSTRKIITHFLGKDVIVDHSNYKNIRVMFEAAPEYCFEFGFLFLVQEIADVSPLDKNNSIGYIETSPINPFEFCFIDINADTRSQYMSFLECCVLFIRLANIDLTS